ncbi:MAG: hypothetical protein AB8G99_26525 [Planctomycetaceae bacterium]
MKVIFMSSNNIFLSVSVFLNLILLAAFYSTYNSSAKNGADLAEVKNTLQERDQSVKTMTTQVNTLKAKVGLQQAEMGSDVDAEDGTVMGGINGLIAQGKEITKGEKSLGAAVRKMREELNNQQAQLKQRLIDYNTKVQEFNNMVAQKDAEVAEHEKAATTAKNELRVNVQKHSEEITNKDQIIADVRTQLSDAQSELEKVRSEKDAIIAARDERIQKQTGSLVRLRREKFEREDLSFEIADGRVMFVDSARKVVTINLGEADGLRPGVTFSVYQKDNSGIGRRNMEDIKGKVEVTSILGPHRAEARILDPTRAVKRRGEEEGRYTFARRSSYYQSSLLRPLAQGDPIYSPAFSKGRQEMFSIVGLIDLDGDGKSDRDLLRNLIRSNGAGLDNEIGDDGEPITGPNPISHRTRFLVMADLGDQDKTEDTRKKAEYQKIARQASKMREDALDAGVRIVSLPAFLDYLGFQPSASPWRDGEDFKAVLSNGAASERVGGGLGQRQSQGNVSGLYHPDKRRIYNLEDRIGRQGTTGNVSDLYNDK